MQSRLLDMAPDKDVENGDPVAEKSRDQAWDPEKDEGEYGNLIRYISTYRDRRFSKAPSQVSEQDLDPDQKKKTSFFKRLLGKGETSQELYEVPEEWLETDIKQGLSSSEVEQRRKHTGYNELTSEKENMFLKFLGYFKGPILYGKLTASLAYATNTYSHGDRCTPCSRPSGLDRLRCHYWHLVA